jgi:hypothetical protein
MPCNGVLHPWSNRDGQNIWHIFFRKHIFHELLNP